MTSFDDQLHDAFEHAGPPPDRFHGDITAVRRTVRRRKATRRALVTTFSVLAVGGAGMLVNGLDPGDRVVISEGGTTMHATSTTPTTTPSTTSTTRSTTSAPLLPSIRDVDLGQASLAPPCPNDERPVTLRNGQAKLPLSDGARYVVSLGPVGYADVDGDGDDDAVVYVQCQFAGASVRRWTPMPACSPTAQPVWGNWSRSARATSSTTPTTPGRTAPR